jgi:hypothetical protein
MRTILLSVLCCLSTIALGLDLLVFRPMTALAQSGSVRVVEIDASGGGAGPSMGTVVGFSCVLDKDGRTQCYVASTR